MIKIIKIKYYNQRKHLTMQNNMVMISNNNNNQNKTINLVFLISKFLKFYGEEYANLMENINI